MNTLVASSPRAGGPAVLPWQTVEGALFSIYLVAADTRKHLEKSPISAADAMLIPDQQQTLSVLMRLFTELTTNASLSSHPFVVLAASRLIGSFAAWFEKPGEPTPSAVIGLDQHSF
jgi:hypothetical protein